MFQFTIPVAGTDRRVHQLGTTVRAHLALRGKVELDAHHPQYGWRGRITISYVESDIAPKTYAVCFEPRTFVVAGEATIEEPLTDERIALAVGLAIGSVRHR
jgi:hypothetical protein